MRFLPSIAECTQPLGSALPTTAKSWFDRGKALAAQRRYAEAITAYQSAISLRPGHYAAHSRLAALLGLNGDADGAIQHYREAIRLHPNDASLHLFFAGTLDSLKRFTEAIPQYQRSIALDPAQIKPHRFLGLLYTRLGNHEAAIREFRRIIEIDPDNADAYLILGTSHGQLGRFGDARSAFEASARLKRANWHAHNMLGVFSLLKGDRWGAVKHSLIAIVLKPLRRRPWNTLLRATVQLAFRMKLPPVTASSLPEPPIDDQTT